MPNLYFQKVVSILLLSEYRVTIIFEQRIVVWSRNTWLPALSENWSAQGVLYFWWARLLAVEIRGVGDALKTTAAPIRAYDRLVWFERAIQFTWRRIRAALQFLFSLTQIITVIWWLEFTELDYLAIAILRRIIYTYVFTLNLSWINNH